MTMTKTTYHSNSGDGYETRVTERSCNDCSRHITVSKVDRSLRITSGRIVSETHVKPNGDSSTKRK